MNANTASAINDALTLITGEIPVISAAYSVLKVIWSRTNPGKTEQDYRDYLAQWSQTNIDETAAILIADGYVENPAGSGNWSKPPDHAPGLPDHQPPLGFKAPGT